MVSRNSLPIIHLFKSIALQLCRSGYECDIIFSFSYAGHLRLCNQNISSCLLNPFPYCSLPLAALPIINLKGKCFRTAYPVHRAAAVAAHAQLAPTILLRCVLHGRFGFDAI